MKYLLTILLFVCSQSWAALTDIKFGQSQIADSQWNTTACLTTTTCQIYSKNPGTAYKIPWTSGQLSWAAGDYVQFELSGNASFPYLAKQYNSSGVLKATMGTGKIVNMGPDYFFFVGSDNNTGQLFSGSSGMSGTGGVTWTGTQNPTIAQADTLANTYSTVPLAAGQTATVTPTTNSAPVVLNRKQMVNRPSGQIQFGANRTPVWQSWWCDNYWGCGNTFNTTYLNWNQGVGDGFHNYNFTYMRWPGTDNGVSKTIWFRVGFDDNSELRINGQWVAGGGYCGNNCYRYGSYTAKPGEIVKLEFWSDNNGGNTYVMSVAWDPQGDGSYQLLGSTDVGLESPSGGGSAYWYSSDITTDQTTLINDAKSRLNAVTVGNRIDLYSDGSGNSVTIEQVGSWNLIQGIGGGNAHVAGFGTAVDIKQGDYSSGKNLIELYVQGNGNNVTLSQARNTTNGSRDGSESGGHYMQVSVAGDINSVTMRQGNDGGQSSGHLSFLYVTGNFNNISIKQANDNEKKVFASATGDSNYMNVTQQGLGNHYLDISLNGNGHSATVTQKDSATHKATINLTNSGGASNLTLLQQGSIGQTYSIFQQCANPTGCSVSVTQQ